MAPNSQWPSVTVTIKPAVFRGHINPQPAAERLVAVPRGLRSRLRAGVLDTDRRDRRLLAVRLVARQLWLHRRRAGGSLEVVECMLVARQLWPHRHGAGGSLDDG